MGDHPHDPGAGGGLLDGPNVCRTAYLIARANFLARKAGGTPAAVDLGRVRERWDGGRDQYGRNYKPIWPRVWEACLSHGLTPDELIDSRFAHALTAKCPEPTDLLNQAVLAEAVRKSKARAGDTLTRLTTQLKRLEDALRLTAILPSARGHDPVEYALASTTADPITRYLFVASARPDLAARLLPKAATEYAVRRPLLAALTPLLPPELVALSDRIAAASRRPEVST